MNTIQSVNQIAIASRAGNEWDHNRTLQGLCDREAYIEDAVRETASSSPANTTRQTPPAGQIVKAGTALVGAGKGGNRVAVINKAKGEWDAEKSLQTLCSREAYVEDQLREVGLSDQLTEKEKELLVTG
jgi:hypothetical protein